MQGGSEFPEVAIVLDLRKELMKHCQTYQLLGQE
jgi:hypothetical protein